MEILANKLAKKIAVSLGFEREKEKVIAYGLFAIIQIIITILLVFIAGLICGTPVEALIICFSVSILRKYSGGAHAGSAEICTTISIIYCTAASMISKYLLSPVYNLFFMLAAIIILYFWALYIIYKRAPVDSPNKPIRTEKKKKRMRKGSFTILFVYFVISIALLMLGDSYKILNSMGISLLFGISWQTFSLSVPGSNFLNRLNVILRKEV